MVYSNKHHPFQENIFHLPLLSLELEELSLSTLGFFFLCDPESEAACLFSTVGVESALFLKSSLSLSRAGSILFERLKKKEEDSFNKRQSNKAHFDGFKESHS